MDLFFDPDFDGGSWPGPLAHGRRAAFGMAWVGSAGLLSTLETGLGLGGLGVGHLERVAALVPAIREVEGFWSRSAEVDALGVAEELLAWRDLLVMSGWQGEGSGRLAALAAVTRAALPGTPDRLRTVLAALATRGVDLDRLALACPLDELPWLWRQVLAALPQNGTRIEVSLPPPATAPTQSDVLQARSSGFRPRGDGTLQLVRSPGPLQAAEDVAAWLATVRDVNEEPTLFVGADDVLDATLARFGLPTVGAARPATENALLNLLPLVLALGWAPPDPQRALELLTLPSSPIPRRLARALVEALHEIPAVGSDAWADALGEALTAVGDDSRRAELTTRVDTLLSARVSRGERFPRAELDVRTRALARWFRARLGTATDESRDWGAAVVQVEAFEQLVRHCGLESFSEAELLRFVHEATAEVGGRAQHEARAGARAVAKPGAVAGAARRIVWWGFTRESAPTVRRLPFTAGERAELEARGVQLPEPSAAALAQARRWRRPLEQCEGTLLLVCPERAAGEALHPHPLWDEVSARVAPPHRLTPLVRRTPWAEVAPPMSPRPPRPTVAPHREWHVEAGSIRHRRRESASSLGTLIGCPLSWVAHYAAGLRSGPSGQLPDGAQLLGSFLHSLLERVLREEQAGDHRTPDGAAARVGELFDQVGPCFAAALFLPGADAERDQARHMAVESARTLFRLLRQHGRSVRAVEAEYEAEALGGTIAGRLDLALEPPLAILDFKSGSPGYRRRELETGSAHQLAFYAALLRNGAGLPPAGYFMLDSQELLTTAPAAFPGAVAVDGPSLDATWSAIERGYAHAWELLERGEVTAAGISAAGMTSVRSGNIESGELVLPPPCRFCDVSVLCGNRFADAEGASE